MNERTATRALEALDKDKWAVQRSVVEIMHILHDYIPRSVMREAEDRLFDAFFVNGIELTTNTMRKEYEYWKTMELNSSLLKANPKAQP